MERKYYWLKLKNDFFATKEMKKLRKIAGGDTYTIIYLKLQLLSLKDEGRLYYDGIEDSFAEELALTIDEDADNVKATLLFLEKCGLVELNGTELFMRNVPSCIGSETGAAERMRELRRNKIEQSSNRVTQNRNKVQNCYTEIDIDKEKEKEIDKDKEKRRKEAAHHKYGEYQNVLLTDEEHDKLMSEFPDDYNQRIERLSGYIASTGKSYKNHLATIRNWAKKDEERKPKPQSNMDELANWAREREGVRHDFF